MLWEKGANAAPARRVRVDLGVLPCRCLKEARSNRVAL
ncbi:hypothetical protein Z947_2343 [Sulfitobacter geojensis]|nr:hypothetical protein Z947_2343 [Sulfitobacter geojensis]